MSHAKFSTAEMQQLFALQVMQLYKIKRGYFIIDDTMQHHTNYCKWIHGVFVLFDHVLQTNLKAICIVVLYYSDGELIKFPLQHKIYDKDTDNMPWQQSKQYVCISKYDLAVEMLEWALNNGFPHCIVLADSWFGIGPFIKELKRLKLNYAVEIKGTYTMRMPCKTPKRTPKGRLAKNQYDVISLPNIFKNILTYTPCGFSANQKEGKEEKVMYHTKIITGRLNSMAGKHRIVHSIDPTKHTTKYFLTDQLTWEATKIISVYSHRWVIEEFFRNAKQFTDMGGATLRSEQGVTFALCLVSWIDFLFHFEHYTQSTAGELSKEPLTIPSRVRQAQYENMEAFVERVSYDEDFVHRWCEVEKKHISRKRKGRRELITIEDSEGEKLDLAA